MTLSRLAPIVHLPFLCAIAISQAPPPLYSYRAFSVVDRPGLEQALNRNGSEGFRLVALSSGLNGNLTAITEKTPAAASYQYKVISGAWAHLRMVHNDAPIVDLLNEAGQRGFRFVPNSVFAGKNVSAAVVLELAPGSNARYAYRVYSPQLPTTSKFEREFTEARKQGFSLVYYGTAGNRSSTLMERQDPASASAADGSGQYRRFECPPKDLRKRLQEETYKEYVPFAVAPWNDFTAIKVSLWLQKTSGQKLQVLGVESTSGSDLSLLCGAYGELADQLNKAGAEGYALVALPVISRSVQGSFWNKLGWTLTAVTSQRPYKTSYRLATGESLPDLSAQINAAAREGFRVVPGSLIAETAILMARSDAPQN